MNRPLLSRAEVATRRPWWPCWYVVHSKARAESIARIQLERQGFVVYFPQVRRQARLQHRWTHRVEPLFPRYLFVAPRDREQSLAPVRSTLGVSDLVRFGGKYATIGQEIVEALMSRADPRTGLHQLAQPVLRHGEQVRIAEGAFESLEGAFDRYDGQERALILVNMLGHASRVSVPVERLVSLPAAH